jgi:hypothetical protein
LQGSAASLVGDHRIVLRLDRARQILRSHLDAEFSFTISGHPQSDGGSELVVNVGRVHRFRVPRERQRGEKEPP